MSPAALYRYFASRDALLADLVVDAYNELADSLVTIEQGGRSAHDHLDAVLRGTRAWALEHPNPYRMIFQTTIGSGAEIGADRTIPAASRSMAVIVDALSRAAGQAGQDAAGTLIVTDEARSEAFRGWAERSGLSHIPVDVLMLAFLTWTRLHGIVSLELGGHLAATGIGADVLFEAELQTIHSQTAAMSPARPQPRD